MTTALTVPGYRLREQIGRGGFGVVHLAEPEAGGPPVAVKVLHRRLDADQAARFAAEVQVMGTLAWHPNVVRILDAGTTDDGLPWIAMEHLGRGSLGDAMDAAADHRPMAWAEVSAAGVQAATGLQVAHNAGLLHRDVKPDNLLLADDGTVKVSDFGVALAAGSTGRQRGTTGTIAYSAPELLAGEGASVASDVYALGATLYALLAGAPAFHRDTDESPAAMILRAYREPVPDLADADVPEPLARAVRRAMAKQPSDRPATAADMARELQSAREALGLAPVPVVGAGRAAAAAPGALPAPAAAVGLPDQPPPEARRRAQRLQRVLGGVGAAAAALVAITFVATALPGGFGDDADDAATDPGGGDGDVAVEEGEEAPPAVGADPPLGAEPPAQGGPGLPATPPAPLPPPPPPGPASTPAPAADVVVTLPLDAEGVAITAVADVVYVSTTTGLARLQGGQVVAVDVPGAADVAATSTAVALLTAAGTTEIRDPASLDLRASLALDAGEVVAAGERFWVTTRAGVMPLEVEGAVGTTIPLPGASHVASSRPLDETRVVVWASSGGTLLAVDADGGRALARHAVDAPVVELDVRPDGAALAVTDDGRVLEVALDGTVRVVADGGFDDVVALGPDTPALVRRDGALLVLRQDGSLDGVLTESTVTLVEPGGPGAATFQVDAGVVQLVG